MANIEQRAVMYEKRRISDPHTLHAQMSIKVNELIEAKKEAVFEFSVKQWQLNPAKQLHGGITSSALDIVMGAAAFIFSDGDSMVTISMQINYVRSAYLDDVIKLHAICDFVGRNIVQLHAWMHVDGEDDIIANANGSYKICHDKRGTR